MELTRGLVCLWTYLTLFHIVLQLVYGQSTYPISPVLDSEEASVSATAGSKAILPCYVRNTGETIISWLDGQWTLLATGTNMDSPNPQLSIQHRDPDEWNLVIDNVTVHDAQTYVCQVQMLPMAMKFVTLAVHDTPKVDKESLQHRYSFKTGSHVNIECQVTGSPPPTVTWYFYETNSTSIEEKKIKVSSTKILEIPKIDKSKDGIYRCEATNQHGQGKYEIYLEITYPPIPTILKPQLSVKVGSTIQLVCKAESKPAPNFAWYHKGQHITPNNRHHMSHDTEDMEFQMVSELTIVRAEIGDSGKYTCSASNIHGREDAEAFLQVIPESGSTDIEYNISTETTKKPISVKPIKPEEKENSSKSNAITYTEDPRTGKSASSASCLWTTVLVYLPCTAFTIFYML